MLLTRAARVFYHGVAMEEPKSTGKMRRTDLFYFSGTGNSLFVANELAKKIPGSKVRPIISLLRQGVILTDAETIGIVFPVHAMTIPTAIKQFLRMIDLRQVEYVFAVATRLGLVFEDFGAIDRRLRKKRRRLDAHFLLNMGSNDVKVEGYRCPTGEKIAAYEADVLKRLDMISGVVGRRERHRPRDTEFTIGLPYGRIRNRLTERFIVSLKGLSERFGGVNYFYVDDSCSGCGICERVCLSGKIEMTGDRPAWSKDVLCHMCYACINYCPKRSVQIRGIRGVVKSYSPITDRYSHPYATAKDIAAQKTGLGW
jgi:ferredoxin